MIPNYQIPVTDAAASCEGSIQEGLPVFAQVALISISSVMLAFLVILTIVCIKRGRALAIEQARNKLLAEDMERYRDICISAAMWGNDVIREVLGNLAMSGNNNDLLISRLRKSMFASGGKCKSIAQCAVAIANVTHNGVINTLKANHPSLTQGELEICSMLILKYPANEIQLVLGHTNDQSYYNLRKRLRHKLSMERSDTIEKFLLSEMNENEEHIL